MATIRSVNLNLFVAFDALLEARSVTRAAARVGVTQSAMSNSLAQLRAIFDDPLFVRGPGGVLPTPRALELGASVHDALALLDTALSAKTFDPRRAERTFTVGTSDFVQFVLLPSLISRVQAAAPGVRIHVKPWGRHEIPHALETGELDLMIGFYEVVPPGHRDALLFSDDLVCTFRADHPRIGKTLPLDRYLELSHVLVSETGDSPGVIDVALAKLGRRRNVAVRVSHALLVPPLVARTDLVAALTRRIAEAYAPLLGLRMLPTPVKLAPGRVGAVWHERLDNDPSHRWLRQLVTEVGRAL